jgi:hypothetical protein
MVLLNISRSFGLRVLLLRIRTPVRNLAGQRSWFYAATNVSETKTRNTTGHRGRPAEACFQTCQSPSPTPKSGCLLLARFWLQVVHRVRRSRRINRLPSLCAPLMSGTIIKIEYIRRIPCQATLEPGGRLTTGWPTIHPKAGPDAGLVAEPQSGLAVARPL